jgi:branched-chain amino acid transport system substrate-binding protein
MNTKYNIIRNSKIRKHISWLLAMAIIGGLFGCSKKIIVPPDKPPLIEDKKTEKEDSLTPILMAEAEKFSALENNQDALFVYNQALSLAAPHDREKIISGIERVLTKTSPKVIEEFLQIKNLAIPRPLLLYWLGLNQASRNNYVEAVKTLTLFTDTYPDHAYAQDSLELLSDIKLATFKKDTIGCLLPLSGKYKIFGQRALQGIQLAVQELSQTHGKHFNVIIKDTQSNPDRAIQCVDELNQERVMGVIGPMLTTQTAGSRAQTLGIPMIALTQKSEFPLQGDYLFSNFITPQMQVQSLGYYVFMELGLTKVAILYPRERYGKLYMELFWDVVDEFNGEIVGTESYDGKNTDFATPIKKLTGEYYPLPKFLIPEPPEEILSESDESGIVESVVESGKTRGANTPIEETIQIDFEALFIPDSLSRVNLILPQLAFNDAKGMVLLGTNLWHQESLLTGAKGYNKNAVITDGYFGNSKNPVTAGFDKRFKALYESQPGFLEAISYDTANILFTAAMDEGVDSRESLKNSLQGSQMFEGVTGNTIFDKTGSPHKELFLITVKRGKFMEISH